VHFASHARRSAARRLGASGSPGGSPLGLKPPAQRAAFDAFVELLVTVRFCERNHPATHEICQFGGRAFTIASKKRSRTLAGTNGGKKHSAAHEDKCISEQLAMCA
jgi:hypothetical protein